MSDISDLFSHLGDLLEQLGSILGIAGQRLVTNAGLSFSTMTMQKWIRLVIVVGTYLLVRPYILKYASKRQEAQFAKDNSEEEAKTQISANSLRGQIDIPEESDDDENQTGVEATTTASDWGKKARKRQRHMLKKVLEAEEKRLQELQEDEEDKDIEQYLVG